MSQQRLTISVERTVALEHCQGQNSEDRMKQMIEDALVSMSQAAVRSVGELYHGQKITARVEIEK